MSIILIAALGGLVALAVLAGVLILIFAPTGRKGDQYDQRE